jgi:hypothetical protein
MNKTIWILWFQGWETAGYISRQCLKSWQKHNETTWKIIALDQYNLDQYASVYASVKHLIDTKNVTINSLADIIKLHLLSQYGGLWIDSTCFCNGPLDKWFGNNNGYNLAQNGFFAFRTNDPATMTISTKFLYANKDNVIIKKWKDSMLSYINSVRDIGCHSPNDGCHSPNDAVNVANTNTYSAWVNKNYESHYFWLNYLFEDLYKTEDDIKIMWDSTPVRFFINKNPLNLLQTYCPNETMFSSILNNNKLKDMIRKPTFIKLSNKILKECHQISQNSEDYDLFIGDSKVYNSSHLLFYFLNSYREPSIMESEPLTEMIIPPAPAPVPLVVIVSEYEESIESVPTIVKQPRIKHHHKKNLKPLKPLKPLKIPHHRINRKRIPPNNNGINGINKPKSDVYAIKKTNPSTGINAKLNVKKQGTKPKANTSVKHTQGQGGKSTNLFIIRNGRYIMKQRK